MAEYKLKIIFNELCSKEFNNYRKYTNGFMMKKSFVGMKIYKNKVL